MLGRRERFSINNNTLYSVVVGASVTFVLLFCHVISILVLVLTVAAALHICGGPMTEKRQSPTVTPCVLSCVQLGLPLYVTVVMRQKQQHST